MEPLHGYYATRYRQMVQNRGGLEAAKRLLRSGPDISSGLKRMWKLGLKDRTVEALVLQDRFESLFTDAERAVARERLTRLE